MFEGVLQFDLGQPSIALDRPSMRALAYVLRHRETWPKGFEWNFQSCKTCAMGLAHLLWKEITCLDQFAIASAFSISRYDANVIFIYNYNWVTDGKKVNFSDITPEMVADEIDHYLVTHPEVA